jgi:nicotinamide-nucleotide amidase
MPSDLIIACSKIIMDQKLTLSFAESATAGRLSSEFALIPKCGQILKGGLVCYDACIKQDILGIPKEIVEKYTPESAEVTRELAERLTDFMKADIQTGVTGLTMPGGSETEEKPVGTMFIHSLIKGKPVAVREVFKGSPEEIVLQTIDRFAQLIIDELSGEDHL